jgi:protein-S-isoprenylcysteine O-methyltransferase Ste14
MNLDMRILQPVHELFGNERIRSTLVNLRVPLGLVAAAAWIWFTDPRWLVPGGIVSLAGACLQTWCFATLKKKKVLAIRGPYALVRNPMYLSRFLIFAGIVLLPGQPWFLIPLTVFYYFYMVNRVKREEAVLAPIFGQAYADYCAAVNRFVPGLRRYKDSPVFVFDWRTAYKNNFHTNFLVVVAIHAAAWGIAAYRGQI